MVNSLGFLFCLPFTSSLDARETSYPEPPKVIENKINSPFSLVKGPGKGKLNRDLVGLHTWSPVGSLIYPQLQQECPWWVVCCANSMKALAISAPVPQPRPQSPDLPTAATRTKARLY